MCFRADCSVVLFQVAVHSVPLPSSTQPICNYCLKWALRRSRCWKIVCFAGMLSIQGTLTSWALYGNVPLFLSRALKDHSLQSMGVDIVGDFGENSPFKRNKMLFVCRDCRHNEGKMQNLHKTHNKGPQLLHKL